MATKNLDKNIQHHHKKGRITLRRVSVCAISGNYYNTIPNSCRAHVYA